MKIDRNLNTDGKCKYALVLRRKLQAMVPGSLDQVKAVEALDTLERLGLIVYGNESPDDQFFTLRYKDQFAASALQAYAEDVRQHARNLADRHQAAELIEYAYDVSAEAIAARKAGRKTPD